MGQHLARTDHLLNQVTFERGHVADEDCIRGAGSRLIERRGAIWLEDLDLSGVPEICQEMTEREEPQPSWGNMLAFEFGVPDGNTWAWLAPALAIWLTITGSMLAGDALAERADA